MFDEHVEELLDDDRARSNELYQRVSSKWLGELRIPFYTVLSSQRVGLEFEAPHKLTMTKTTKQKI